MNGLPFPPGREEADGHGPVLLALRALGLGDFATAVPALRALERSAPSWRRVLAGPPWYRDLLALAGLSWEVLPTEPLAVPGWDSASPPDLAVNLHGRGPESTAALAALSPRVMWAFGHRTAVDREGPDWPPGVHDAEVWCRLLREHGTAADPTDLRWPRPVRTTRLPDTVIVHPGAAAPSRRWPVERFARVARHLAGSGLRVLVTGSRQELSRAEAVAAEAGLGPGSVLAGRTGLVELARLVAGAGLLVCGDTGVGHLATAYSTPSVRLFGPVSPELWGPLVDRDSHRCLWAGRRGDPHSEQLDPGLESIGVEEVLAACAAALDAPAPFPVHGEGSGR
ncbi:glycosyltransferase family 9 protein [Nocardiopsis tropica]|uniref:Glycosyltransferase family 9 protein n=1 Tax=Nocardiopsis tropica TaxID=109330 RepID=A0ABU7KKQ0_9ACTN|nr:glycosyltransferase family 9 protein [Nocardiopsis umidischolae]MEE2049875.1 glycosyltransferase family 9 protein [Nocardiopsis umidischolae]